MAMFVNTNIASLNAQRNLEGSTSSLNKSLERLSSGLRINSAGDDAAGLAISTGMESQVEGLNQAVRNANDGLSLVGTAESALSSYTDMLQRVRTLAVQSANDTNSTSNRVALDQEAQQLLQEMQRIASTVQFNGTNLLDGTFTSKQLQVGAQAGQTINVTTGDLRTSVIGQVAQKTGTAVSLAANPTDTDLTLNGIAITDYATYADDVSTSNNIRSALTMSAAINAKTSQTGVTATVGPAKMTAAAQTVQATTMDISGGDQLTINGVDIFSSDVTILAGDSDGSLCDAINNKSNETGVTAKVDASGNMVLTAEDGRNIAVTTVGSCGDELGFVAANGDYTGSAGGTVTLQSNNQILVGGTTPALAGFTAGSINLDANMAINKLSISTVAGANLAIDQVDNALNQINAIQATLGATTNRLEYTVSSLQSVSENLSSAKSTIMDADFAAETATLTKNQILQQAGVAVLSQANTNTQLALKLLPS